MVALYDNKLNGILADEMGLGKTIQVPQCIPSSSSTSLCKPRLLETKDCWSVRDSYCFDTYATHHQLLLHVVLQHRGGAVDLKPSQTPLQVPFALHVPSSSGIGE